MIVMCADAVLASGDVCPCGLHGHVLLAEEHPWKGLDLDVDQ